MRQHRLLIIAPVVCSLFLAAPARAGVPTDQLRTALEKVTRALDDPGLRPEDRLQERQAAVLSAVVDLLDFQEMSRRALARHWRQLTDGEREEFVGLFRAVLERTYLPRIKLYKGERVSFVGESQDGDLATVQARVLTRTKEIPVAFRLHRVGGGWLIYDLSVEGISLIANYRAQFDQIVQRASLPGLMERMRQKVITLEPLQNGPPAAPR